MKFSQFNSSLNFQSVDQVRNSSHASHLISSSPLFSPFRLSRMNSKSSETNRSTFIFLSSLLHFNVCSCDIFSLHQSGICVKGSCSSIKIISTVCSHHRFHWTKKWICSNLPMSKDVANMIANLKQMWWRPYLLTFVSKYGLHHVYPLVNIIFDTYLLICKDEQIHFFMQCLFQGALLLKAIMVQAKYTKNMNQLSTNPLLL